MTFCSVPVQNSGLAQALNIADFELCFAGAAVGTTGKIYSLLNGQLTANAKAFLAIGGTSDVTAIVPTASPTSVLSPLMSALVTPEQYQVSQVPVLPNDVSNLTVGLANYFDEIEVKGNSADCIGFAVQGLPIKQVLAVELVVKQAATMTNVEAFKAGPALVLPEPITLGSSSEIIKTGTTEIDFDTDVLNICIKNQLVFGSLKIATGATLAPAAGDILVLRIKAVV